MLNLMIIGFLGKGGSGKSTLSAALVRQAVDSNKRVLAIDADHNMDLSFNLAGKDVPAPYLGDAFWEIRRHFGLQDHEEFSSTKDSDTRFTVTQPDAFTSSFQHTLSPMLSLMLTAHKPKKCFTASVVPTHSLPHSNFTFRIYILIQKNWLWWMRKPVWTQSQPASQPGLTLQLSLLNHAHKAFVLANKLQSYLLHTASPMSLF